ncbi:MAG TPA: lipoate--protein ligase [Anaerolineaceae bacterium]|nr:lipoate--protein ligase [Anaerolineaceae bacterium]
MRVIDWTGTDAYFNLALEDYVFNTLAKGQEYLILWQNKNAVVVGRHQNILEEINTSNVREHDIQIVRRLSGGGAVYHDLGNLNFSFIFPVQGRQYDFKTLSLPIFQTLVDLGVPVQFSQRNDLLLEGKKISGSAQSIKSGHLLHHGTLLFHSNLDMLQAVLKKGKDEIVSRGVKSVHNQVTNIQAHYPDITMDIFKQHFKEWIETEWELQLYEMSTQDIEEVQRLCDEKYHTWNWNYGSSPAFDVRRTCATRAGDVEVFIQVQKGGIIQSIRFFGFSNGEREIAEIEDALQGVFFREEDVKAALRNIGVEDSIPRMTVDELCRLIVC